jgi:D-alanyl-D-alanine carboxypeptidase
MKSRSLVTRGAALSLALTAAVTCAVPAQASPGTRGLDALADQTVRAGAPGIAVRVSGPGSSVDIARQAAWTRADHRLSADDQFRMASNTKTMVGTVALQLVAEHRLSLDDKVEKWLPGLVSNGGAITVRMLLNHTSGLPDYIYAPEALLSITGQVPRSWQPKELLALVAGEPPLAPPGASYSYSTTNYIAAGLILERAGRRSLPDLLTERIFRPLGLRDTYFATDGTSRDGDRLAHGYEPDREHVGPLLPPGTPDSIFFVGPQRPGHVDVTNHDQSWLWAAGGVVSTPADWERFLKALLSGKLLPPAQLAQMRTTVEEPGSEGTARYGLGLEQYLSPCGPVWGHTGGDPGYGSQNYVDDSGRSAVTVVTTTLFGTHEPTLAAADHKMVDGAICAMLRKPIPAG